MLLSSLETTPTKKTERKKLKKELFLNLIVVLIMSSFSSENMTSSRDHSFDDFEVPSSGKIKKKLKTNKKRIFTVVLVASDCFLIGLQPILVHLTKNSRGGFAYHPVSVNFITEGTKVIFAIVFLMVQVRVTFLRFSRSARDGYGDIFFSSVLLVKRIFCSLSYEA